MALSGNAARALAGLAVALALGGAAAASVGAAEDAAGRRDVGLEYDIYFGGFEVLKLDVALAFEGDRYELEAALETRGMAELMFSWSLRTNASGKLDGARVRPVWAYSENVSRGEKRWTSLRFGDQGPKVVGSSSKRESPGVPPDDLRDAVDVASAILLLSRSVQSGQECDTKVPAFDGKRRFDFVVARLGEEKLVRSRYSAFSGTALLCRVAMEMLHGRKRERDYGGFGSQGRVATIWIAPVFEDVPPMPVRLEYDTRWGMVIAHLSRANLAGGGRNRTLTPRD